MPTYTRYPRVWVVLLLSALFCAGCTRQAKQSRHYRKANDYLAAGQYDKAEVEYLTVLAIGAGTLNTAAVQRLGTMYLEQGRILSAAQFLRQARRLNTNDLEGRISYGKLLLTDRRTKEVREEALFVLARSPAHAEALRLLSACAESPKEAEEARQRLQQLRQRLGDQPALLVALGLLELKQHDYKAAETAFQRALALDPKSDEACAGLAEVFWAQGNPARAEQFYKMAAELAPVRSPKRVQYALFKIRTSALPQARTILEAVTQQAPDYLPAWKVLVDVALNEDKLDEAGKLLDKILAREPLDYEALLLRARLHGLENRPAEALQVLARLSLVYTNSPQALLDLGTAYVSMSEPSKAIDCLRRALKLNTNFVDARLMLAREEIQTGDTAAAIAAMNDLVRRKPPVPQAFMLLAKAQLAQRAPEEALATYQRMIASFPKAFDPVFQMGLVNLELNRPGEAQKAFEKAWELAPGNLLVLEHLVNLDLLTRSYDKALQRLQPLLLKNPKAVGVMLLQGRVYARQGNFAQAETVLNRVLDLDAGARGAYMMLAEIYVATKRHTEALGKLHIVVAQKTNDWQAFAMMAAIQEQTKDYAAAAAAYQSAIAINPRNIFALNNLAYVYSERLDQLDKAYDLAQQARRLAPRNPYAADTLGWILCKRGDYWRALPLLLESVQTLATDPDVLCHLGMAFYMMAEEASARLAFERALQSKKDFPGKQAAERRATLLRADPDSPDPKTLEEMEKHLDELPGKPVGDPVALVRSALLSEKNGAFEKARSAYEKALKINPKSIPTTLKLARLCLEHLSDPKRALELARNARELAPQDPNTAYSAGKLALAAGDHKWALGLLLSSARELAGQPAVLYDLAVAHFNVGQTAEAEAALRKATQAGTTFPQVGEARRMLEMITLAADAERAEAGAARIQEILKTDPDNVPALAAAAAIYERRGNKANAKQAYERVLALRPFFDPATRKLALLYAESPADEKKAYDLAVKAREAYPQDAELAGVLGILAFKRGDFARSAQLLREGLKRSTNNVDLLFRLGLAQHKLKPSAESKTNLVKALALAPGHNLAPDARRALADQK